MRVTAIALLAAACGGAPARTVSNQSASPGTLGEQLVHELGDGKSVAILPSAHGLVAMSSDGKHQRTLADGKISWAIVDPRTEVIWFATYDGHELLAIDLEAPASAHPNVAHVVAGLPSAVVTIVYPKPKPPPSPDDDIPPGALDMFGPIDGYSPDPWPAAAHVLIDVAAEPALESRGSTMYGMEDSNQKVAADTKLARIVDRAFLVELAKRPDHSHPLTLQSAGKLPIDPAKCEGGSDDCGKIEAIPGTKYQRIVVQSTCGDSGCHQIRRLYNTETKKFLGPDQAVKNTREEWGFDFLNAWLSPDREGFVASGRLIRFDRGIVFDPADGDEYFPTGGGWVGGGGYVDY